MNFNADYCRLQYDLVRDARAALLDYCETIAPQDFMNANSSFGRGGSIRNLLVHIANTYEFWIAGHALKTDRTLTEYNAVHDVKASRSLFNEIDDLIATYFDKYSSKDSGEIRFVVNGLNGTTTPFKLFTHVITHEFHHKGQILSLSRHLGYIPADTDVMR